MRFKNLSYKKNLKKSLLNKISELFDSGAFINGPKINLLENKLASLTKRKYAVAVGSGTAALILSLRVLNLKKGDEVIVPCMSWISTANAVVLNNLKPVFADIGNDLNISIESVEKLINKNVKAILYVNFGGRMADIQKLNQLSKKYRIPLIEDGSQSFGAKYNKIINGENGVLSAISLNPMKILNSIGEAGVILTNNKKYYLQLKKLRTSGVNSKGICIQPSENAKMDTIQAISLIENLKHYKSKILIRRKNAQYIKNKLSDILDFLDLPELIKKDSFYILVALHPKRNKIIDIAKKYKIELKIHHYPLMPDMPFYKKANFRKDVDFGKKISKKIFSIPFYEEYKKRDLDYVISILRRIIINL